MLQMPEWKSNMKIWRFAHTFADFLHVKSEKPGGKDFFEFLAQYSKFHKRDLAIISQFQYKHEATTYESFSDQNTVLIF